MRALRTVLLGMVAVIGLVAVGGALRAGTGVVAWRGRAAESPECFVSVAARPGTVQQVCSGVLPGWDIPLDIVRAGQHTATLKMPVTSTYSCGFYGFDGGTGALFSKSFGTATQGSLILTAKVPEGGSMMVRCFMNQGGQLHYMMYDP